MKWLTSLSSSLSGQFSFNYDALSRRTLLTRPNGVNTSYSYDSLSRLLTVVHRAGDNTLDGAGYAYDNAGNRTSKTNYLNNTTENYGYDNIYQLLQVMQGANTSENYTYDLVGNRLSSLGVAQYTVNSSNQLASSSDGTSYTYDNNENTLTKTTAAGTTSYAWDFENRLTQVTLPGAGGTVSFKYDPFGRRIQKSGPSGTVNYLYDGANVVEEVDPSGNVLARYAQGSGIDEPLAMLRSGLAYYQQDGLGSVTSLSDAGGSLAQTYTFDAFGKQSASSGTLTNPFQYTGREFDVETGLFYYRARYYDPSTGRFTSEDAIKFDGGANFYTYSANNPAFFTDPSGLAATCGNKKKCPPKWKQKLYDALIHALVPPAAAAQAVPNLGHGGVIQIGVGGAAVLGGKEWPKLMPGIAAVSGLATLAFDQHGNIALVLSGSGVGNGLGTGAVGGVQLAISPLADNVFQLEGWSMTAGIGGGTGAGGALEYGWGSTPGGTITETAGAGKGGFAPAGFYGYTHVIPLVCQ